VELVLASNFDDSLVDRTAPLPVRDFFGGFPVTLIGAGRPPQILPSVTPEAFRRHVEAVHRTGRRFFATLNSNDLGLKEYAPGFLDRFRAEVARLLDLGVDGFVVALPLLIEAIHAEWPDVPISASTFARIRTIAQGEYFLGLGARTLVLEEANRDLALVEGLRRAGAEVEILVNQTCLRDCPFRAHHLNTSSLASQPGALPIRFEVPILECGLELAQDPAKLIASIWVRPEDLEVYEEVGVHRFKISGRNRATDWLVRAATAYAARRYDGDLLDLLSLVQLKGPSRLLTELGTDPATAARVAPYRRVLDPLAHLSIDNAAFPPGFFRRVTKSDCAHRSCRACGYCANVAERVLRIDGRPPSAFRPVAPPGPVAELLEPLAAPAPAP
jgi:collagenase-like PrtC family protease